MKSNWSLWQIITNNALEISVDTPWDYIQCPWMDSIAKDVS